MSEQAISFVRSELAPERQAPVRTTGLVGFLRTRLFNTPGNAVLTVLGIALLVVLIVPTVRFLLIDAVWTGSDRNACLAQNAGHALGACWPFVQAKFTQFIYGFYPEPERWRVNLTFLLAALLLLPLLIPRLPAKAFNATLFFLAFPFVAFFLLYGGGLKGFAVEWMTHFVSTFIVGVGDAGARMAEFGLSSQSGFGPLLKLIGDGIVWFSTGLLYLCFPLFWLRDLIVASDQPLWADFAATAVIVSVVLFLLGGGPRNGWRVLALSLAMFAGLGLVIGAMGLDHGGLPVVDTRLWGGLLVTLVVSVTGIVASMPVGIALALGRRSTIPLIRLFSVGFIEFWRGVPLITVLFFATYMLPLFLPPSWRFDPMARVLVGEVLFAGADRGRYHLQPVL
ncbi:MAG: ABC transporter permease subunit, partial [Xanthobacteraceae bacterium]